MDKSEDLLVGMGNPLLDLQITTSDTDIHKKYGLSENGAELISTGNRDALMPIFDDISSLGKKIEYVPGGSAQNTVRVCQWMTKAKAFGGTRKSCYFFGAVGKDSYGEILNREAQSAGIEVRYQELPNERTGTCAVLVHGGNRSLVAYLGAAEHFTRDHLDIESNKLLVEKVGNFYVEGYFLTVSVDSILCLAKHAASSARPKYFAFNLSAEYICRHFREPLEEVLPYVDILFGNAQEAAAYAEAGKSTSGDPINIGAIALHLSDKQKVNTEKKRIVVITQGQLPVLVAHNGKVTEFEVEPIPEGQIVDTNGAGDAFCGGFLAAFFAGRPVASCVRAGNFAARTIIKQIGCTFPSECDYSEE